MEQGIDGCRWIAVEVSKGAFVAGAPRRCAGQGGGGVLVGGRGGDTLSMRRKAATVAWIAWRGPRVAYPVLCCGLWMSLLAGSWTAGDTYGCRSSLLLAVSLAVHVVDCWGYWPGRGLSVMDAKHTGLDSAAWWR